MKSTPRGSVTFHDSTNAERHIGAGAGGAARVQAAAVAGEADRRHNEPPFTVVKSDHRENQPNWRDLLNYVKNEGKKDSVRAALQRSGRDERRATGRNHHESRRSARCCKVRLEDAVESEEIFSTLMGEDVESRRKFIEENALDVKNLDVSRSALRHRTLGLSISWIICSACAT